MSNKTRIPLDFAALLRPNPKATTDRRVWGIPLNGVLVPFFAATNTVGQTTIPADVLGYPLRLAKDEDGTPRFSKKGNPLYRVAPELAGEVRTMRENFISSMVAFTTTVRMGKPDGYKAQVEAAHQAGEVLAMRDAATLDAYLAAKMGEAKADAEAEPEKVLAAA